MKKLDLNTVVGEFEIIDSETHLFYNTQSGEFDYFCDFMQDNDSDKFDDAC